MTEERKNEIISLLGRIATLHIATDEMEQRGIKYSEVMEFLSELSYPDDTFKRKMAELAAKYNISHKRDIDWHNFVAEVEQLTRPELAESEGERIRKRIRLCLDECVHSDIIRDYERDEVLAYLEKQKEKPAEWSEEDEKKITFLERLIRYNVPEGQYGWTDGHRGGFITKLEAIAILKSLRPSWKPSEEQMTALENVIKCELSAGLHTRAEILAELYEQLKKL